MLLRCCSKLRGVECSLVSHSVLFLSLGTPLIHEMANTMQISKDELEELKEAFAKVGKSHRGGHRAPVCCTFGLDLSHPCDEQQCQQDGHSAALVVVSVPRSPLAALLLLPCPFGQGAQRQGHGQSGYQGALAGSLVLLLQGGLCCFLMAEEISTKQVLHCLGLGSTSGLAQCLVLVMLVPQIG